MAYVMVHYWSLLQHNKKWKLRKNNCDPSKKVPSKYSLGLAQVHEVMMRKMGGRGGRKQFLLLEAPKNKRGRGLRREGTTCFTQ